MKTRRPDPTKPRNKASLALAGLWTLMAAAGLMLYLWRPEGLPAWSPAVMAAGLWLAGLAAFGLAGRKFDRARREQADSGERPGDESGLWELPMTEGSAGQPELIAMDDLLRLEQAMVERTADLESQQRQVQSFLNSLEAGAYLKNERHEFIMVNPSLCAILGGASADILGSTGYDFLPRTVAWRMVELERQVIQEGQALELYDLFDFAEHTGRRVYNLHIFPVFSPDGSVEGTGGMILDATERHRLNQAILEAKAAAEKANMTKSAFLANMSHEVRTPLNGILGMADLLLRSQLTRDQISMIATIKNAGYSLLMVLNDILDISKIEAGKMSLETLAFNLRDLVFESTTSLASLAKNKPVEMMVNIPPEVPDLFVGDPVRLRQIILNLVSNALKFTSEGKVAINIEMMGKAAPEAPSAAAATPEEWSGAPQPPKDAFKLRFSVSDTGIGIPPEKQAIIFQPFEQADASTTRTHGGTGLGLAICHRILTMMDSRLELTSRVGQGSTFWFELVLPVAAAEELPRMTRPLNLAQLAGRSILMVDDNDHNRRSLMEELRSLGLNSTEAAGVDEALRHLKLNSSQGQPFDLVITDNIMPDKSGLDLLKEMRDEPNCGSIPVILLTSGEIPASSAGQDLKSFSAVIAKPVRPVELVAAITSALNISELSGPAGDPGPPPSAKSLRVLLVEDVEMNQVVATRLLEELGHRVVVAGDGTQALAFLKERGANNYSGFDLVLMDIQMPGLDGLETTAALRRLENKHGWPPLPVVAMTAHAMKGDREKYMAAGMDDYLTKPVLLNDLADLMERLAAKIQNGTPPRSFAALKPDPVLESKTAAVAFSPDAPVMDEKVIKLSFGNNQKLLKKSMEIYLRDAPNLVNSLKKALKADDLKQTAAMAHAIKGISGYYTKGGPFELARLLDQAARNFSGPEMKTELSGLSAALEQAVAALIAAMNERLKDQDEAAA